MAKIQDLNVGTLKFKDGSLSQFFAPYSGALGTNRYINVVFDAYSTPALIWVRSISGTTNLYYNYGVAGQELVYQASGNVCVAIGDLRGVGTSVYALQGSGSATITGAFMRFR